MATITVDGQQIEAPAGASLLETIRQNGHYVSSLCYIDGLKPYAGCRTCLVDVEGMPGLQLSCTAVVQDGMKVNVDTDQVRDGRRSVMGIILANHSDRCLTCHRREHCHPGDICLRDDVVTHRCLTCAKNYRCELQATCEVVKTASYEPYLGEERSYYASQQPTPDRGNPYFEFDPQMCIICTRCVRTCDEVRHTGAITLSGRGYDSEIAFGAGGPIHDSNCDFCGSCVDACPVAALMEHPNKWVAKPERWTSTTCDSCATGCSIQLGQKDGRGVIVRPGDANPVNGNQLCVRGRFHYDSLKPRDRIQRHLLRRGLIQAPAPFEDAVQAAADALRQAKGGKLAVLTGGNITLEEGIVAREIARSLGATIDQAHGPVIRATKKALEARFGTWRMATDLTGVATAKTIVVIHDDIEESHNIISLRAKDAVTRNGAKLVVIGPLRSELVDFASAWIPGDFGNQGTAADHLAAVIAGKATAADDATATAASILKDAVPEETVVICAPNPVSEAIAGNMTAGAANLALAVCGEAASQRLAVLPPAANTNGLLDLGIGATDVDASLDGVNALLVIRDDPSMRMPLDAAALRKLDALVVIDNVLHPTAKAATVVIAEGRAYASAGSYTNADFRVQRLSPAIQPEGEAVRCFDALVALAGALGATVPADVDAAMGAVVSERPEYRAAWDLLVGDGIRLDVPRATTGRAVPVDALTAAEGTRLIVSRDLYTAADAAALRHPEAEKLHRYDRIQVNEDDAERLGIADGDTITVVAGDVTIEAGAWVVDRVPAGSVYISSLFQGGVAAGLFNGATLPSVSIKVAVPV